MAKNLGKVGFALKGEWSAVVTYDQLEVVFYEGKVYAAKRSSTNVQPDSSPADWMMWAGSPVITSSAITGGHAVTITNADGTSETINVLDGEVTNEVLSETLNELIGNLANLTTTDKSNVVAAINELDSDVDELQEGMETKAEIDGYYEDLTAGSAEQLISSVAISDNAPYNFRTSGGSIDIGDRETDKLVGGTVAWNQLVKNGDFSDTSNWTASIGQGTFTVQNNIGEITGVATNAYLYQPINTELNHVFIFGCDLKATKNISSYFSFGSDLVGTNAITTSWTRFYKFGKKTATSTNVNFIRILNQSELTASDVVNIRNAVLIDLTQMFGSAIADHIYALETANAGDGVAWFRKYFPKDYYAYNAGQLMSVKTSEHKMTGFNQWDEVWEVGMISSVTGENSGASADIRSKNYISVVPNAVYYITCPKAVIIDGYDANKKFIGYLKYGAANSTFVTQKDGVDVYYVRFCTASSSTYGTTYNHDICINLHWDGERDGEYEAYKEHSYALDPDLELRGILKLDANDELYYDGDVYESDGTVTRKYGIVDLGTLTWTYRSSNAQMETSLPLAKLANGTEGVCQKYVNKLNASGWTDIPEGCFHIRQGTLRIKDSSYSDTATFKTAMSGVYLVYELATPTTESADPYTNPQIVNDWGTEEYVDIRDVQIPVGHETLYQANLKAKLEMAPNSPSDGDGDYIVRQTNGENAYVKLVKELPEQPNDTVDYGLKSNSGSLSWQKYDEMIVGNAKQLISSVGIEDQVPYNFRTSGGSNDIGTLEEDTVVGGTVVWNNMLDFTDGSAKWKYNGSVTHTWSNGVLTLSNASTVSTYAYQEINEITGHKYLYYVDGQTTLGEGITDKGALSIYVSGASTYITKAFNTTRTVVSGIFNGTTELNRVQLRLNNTANTLTIYAYMMVDLTQMFGSTIADYLYTLETSNAGAGVAWFKKLFPKSYYPYNSGELMSVKTSAHQMTRFNQWDEEWESGSYNVNGVPTTDNTRIRTKNPIRVIGGVTYYMKTPTTIGIRYYDANDVFIPDGYSMTVNKTTSTPPINACYLRFSVVNTTTYNNDICISFHWDGERDGEYEPYKLESYPLDSDLELKGIPKLDASNNLYYDGDIYEPDGTVTRKYGTVDLGTLSWTVEVASTGMFYSNVNAIKLKGMILNAQGWTCQQGSISPSSWDDKSVGASNSQVYLLLRIKDSAYANMTAAQFKTAMSGKYIIYELATPTTEEADPYTTPQIVDDWGTEEYVDERTVPIPVGHKTFYQANLKAKLEMAPDSPGDGDGLYAVRQTDGENSYEKIIFPTELPAAPTTDGFYRLKVTVTNGTPVLSWESIS